MSNTEFQVVTYTAGDQNYPFVTSLEDGGFVIIWESSIQESSYGIYGQRYNEEGYATVAEFQISTDKDSYQITPTAAALNASSKFNLTEPNEQFLFGIPGPVKIRSSPMHEHPLERLGGGQTNWPLFNDMGEHHFYGPNHG